MNGGTGSRASWTDDDPALRTTTTRGRRAGGSGLWSWQPVAAAVVAVGLGVVAAVMLVAGHHPWDGRAVVTLYGAHGLHRGDILAVGPALAGMALAAWCLRQGRA